MNRQWMETKDVYRVDLAALRERLRLPDSEVGQAYARLRGGIGLSPRHTGPGCEAGPGGCELEY